MTASALPPLILARAPAWPETALAGLGRSTGTHTEAVAADRIALYAVTMSDARFARALAVSNPELSLLAERHDPRGPRNKRARHLETALYRYLARAVGRAAPCDLWAGVTIATFGARTAIEACPAMVVIAPDLRPFQALLRGLGRRPQYRRRGHYRLNPTLTAVEGGWRWSPDREAPDDQPILGAHPVATKVIDVLGSGVALPYEVILAEAISASAGAERLLDKLIDARILVGGLDLPVRFATPDEALTMAAEVLSEPERGQLERTRVALLGIAEELEAIDALTPAQIRDALDRAKAEVAQLAAAWQIELELPRVVLRFDLALPFRMTLGPELKARLEDGVDRYERFQATLGLAAPFREALYRRLAATPVAARSAPSWLHSELALSPQSQSWEALGEARGASAGLGPRLAAWDRALRGEQVDLVAGVPEPGILAPLGCLVSSLESSAGSVRQRVHGLLDEPLSVYSRFAVVLAGAADELEQWLKDNLHRAASAAGIELWEYAGDFEASPNALGRPTIIEPLVSPWRAEGVLLPIEATIGGAPPLLRRSSGPPVAVLSTVAAPFARDPLARLLLVSGFHDAPFEGTNAASITFAAERAQGGAPAIALGPDLLVRPRRTILTGDALAELLEADAESRFALCRSLAARHEWPERIWLRRDGEAPLLVVRDSPLAWEAALEGCRGASALVIESGPEPGWLCAPSGERHALELMVSFARTRHAWSPQ